jgi:ribosomal protein L37AE/L43A
LDGVVGVHTGELVDEIRYGVVVRRWTTDVLVAAPRVKDDGFTRTIWRFENGIWTSKQCAKTYKEALKEKLTELLPE